jgi:hypothetical protein
MNQPPQYLNVVADMLDGLCFAIVNVEAAKICSVDVDVIVSMEEVVRGQAIGLKMVCDELSQGEVPEEQKDGFLCAVNAMTTLRGILSDVLGDSTREALKEIVAFEGLCEGIFED